MKKVFYLAIIFFVFFLRNGVYAGEPPREPILRIETGMHISGIKRIGVDAENLYLVTGSDDKTIRVWELSTGRLLKIIRPPIGDGNEGKIYAVAISPDGRTIACAGWTGQNWDDRYASIYFFDRESGRLIKRISGLSATIDNLTYSKDGMYIVAGLWGNNGIRIYRTSDYSLVAEDRDYSSDSYGADFDIYGRLVTTSLDGYVRLYDNNFRLIAKKRAPSGSMPYGVSFSPDGSKIAVGFHDSTKVDVLSGRDLSYLYSPDSNGVTNGDMAAVSWSQDGNFLYAGGSYSSSDSNNRLIRKWTDEGKGSYIDLSAAQNVISQILPLRYGGIVFCSGAPAFGVFDTYDRIVIYKSPVIADYRGNNEGFLVSYNGSTVQFGYEEFGRSPARFSVEDRLLELNPESSGSILKSQILNPPKTSVRGLTITDWENTYNPKVNGIALKLYQYEISRSVAISPDNQSFILGSDWHLRLFDRHGNLKWKVPAPGTAWSVNISGDGKLAIGAFGDGTIRWYRMRDGKELLALFPHKDRKRWVLWTPEGYYTASAGGEEFIGWHINNGKDREADFFPASRFRERFHRPDIIAKLFQTLDEERAIALANEESGRKRMETSIKEILPPVITILSPSDGTKITKNELIVRYSIRNPSKEPVTAIKVLIDGRPVSQKRAVAIVPKDGERGEITVEVPERDIELTLIAENKYSASVPSSVRLYWAGERKEFVVKPKLYILAIGISKYKDESLRLNFAHKDAQDFVNIMKTQKDLLYEDVKERLLIDEKATKDEILDGLDWLQKETTHKDIAMLFIAGHGVNDPAGIYYFLPQNADIERLKRTGIAFSEIKNTVSSIAGKVVMFVDTCHSGGVMGKRAVADITGLINELTSAENGVVVFASSTGRQYSLEDPAWGNGAFTKAVVEGLGGRADLLGKGKITINMLDAYIAERVKELTKGRQTPTTTKPNTVPDFPVAVRK